LYLVFVVEGRAADEAAVVEQLDELLGPPLAAEALHVELELGDLRGDLLEEAEVQERHPAVVEQHRVAGVRVAAELVVAVHAAEVEAEDHLADAVALLLGQ